MMRKFLLASVGAIALTGSALAADLPPPVYVPPVPIFTWTGPYIGAQVGYAWATGSGNFTGFDPFTGLPFTTNAGGGNPSGIIGGGNVGYNYQIPGWNWFSSSGVVIGLEGSVDGSNLNKTAVATVPIFGGMSTVDAHSTLDIQGSIRGRLGVAWDRVLMMRPAALPSAASTPISRSSAPTFSELRCSARETARPRVSGGRSVAASNMP